MPRSAWLSLCFVLFTVACQGEEAGQGASPVPTKPVETAQAPPAELTKPSPPPEMGHGHSPPKPSDPRVEAAEATPKLTPEQLSRKQKEQTEKQLKRLSSKLRRIHRRSTPPALPPALWELIEPAEGPPTLKPRDVRDAWGNDVIYTVDEGGAGFSLSSVGPDNTYGSADDIVKKYTIQK